VGKRPRELAYAVAALAPFGLWQLFYNWLRTGNPLLYAIMLPQFAVPFELKLHLTIPALLVSPGCGLLVYNPALLAGIAGIRELRKHRLFVPGVIGVALHFVFYATASTWYTYSSWGPRYLVMILPVLARPLAFARPRWRGLLAVSAALQLLAVSVDVSNLLYFHSAQPDIGSVWKPGSSEIADAARELPHVTARGLGLEASRDWPELKPARQASANYGSFWFVVAGAMGISGWIRALTALGLIGSLVLVWRVKLRPQLNLSP